MGQSWKFAASFMIQVIGDQRFEKNDEVYQSESDKVAESEWKDEMTEKPRDEKLRRKCKFHQYGRRSLLLHLANARSYSQYSVCRKHTLY